MPVNPMTIAALRGEDFPEYLRGMGRNAAGLPANLAAMGTGLVGMAGAGLGTLAGMVRSKLKGEDIDWNAASEGVQELPGRITEATVRRTPVGTAESKQYAAENLGTLLEPVERGMQWAGQTTAEKTGSPALGAAVYTGLNVLDPQMAGPAAAKVAALRGAQRVARSATSAPVQRRGGIGTNQSGAWSPADIADVEGNFELRSTVEDALTKLKPQEQKARGRQMLRVLEKYGAKREELEWSGLNALLEQDMPVSADDVRDHLNRYGVRLGEERFGQSGPDVAKGLDEFDEDEIFDKVRDLVFNDDDLRYPEIYSVRDADGGNEVIRSFDSQEAAEEFIERYRTEMAEADFDYYRDEIGPEQNDDWESMTDEQKDAWATAAAQESANERALEIDSEVDADAEPENYDELFEYWRREVERDPSAYGISNAANTKPAKWAEYVVGEDSHGIGQKGSDYGETLLTLEREGLYGRGVTEDLDNTPVDGRSAVQQAQVAALRARMEDPHTQKAQETFKYLTHFPTRNPLVYTRESTMGVPPGATTAGDMRFIEELQSDWGQKGRKAGIYDPDEAAAEAAKRLPKAREKFVPMLNEALALFEQLTPVQQMSVVADLGHATPDVLRERAAAAIAGDDVGELVALAEGLPNRVYWQGTGDVERAAYDLRRRAEQAAAVFTRSTTGKLPPAPFIEDPRKWGKLGLQQAIIDAVRRGDQYIGWTPGYVHAPERWGSEDFAWWTPEGQPQPVPENQAALPGMEAGGVAPVRKAAARGTRLTSNYDYTRGEDFNQIVAMLREGKQPATTNPPAELEINPFAPDAQQTMEVIVREYLSYEAPQYADPEQFIKDRATKILDNMRKESEGRYSPRIHGMHEFYDKQVPAIMERILKEAGSSGSGKGVQRFAEASNGIPMGWQHIDGEWRAIDLRDGTAARQFKLKAEQFPHEFRYEPPRMHYVEIDPELARAAKRGFKLPF